ncbi:hypothetical protein BGY98DRAFT_692427 [Russula aff. rugulosa BPL654]|nr:hypothetical protein BGY98DRAFT_692427 [Russula aff. rugulosa BPL654]
MYLDGVKEDDQRATKTWKDDANGILVFSGLFTATVGAFVIEFYKRLTPDSGIQTVALLGQIFQQLANSPYGNHFNSAIQPPPPPSASMVWVNAMWLISLVLGLASALTATLLQQLARRCVEMPKIPIQPNHRAQVRLFLFVGAKFYKVHRLAEIALALLHLSVYLFFAGLVIIFHTINTKVAIAVDIPVGLYGLAYIMLSILPCLDFRCPYITPMSSILWYPFHIFSSFAAYCLFGLCQLYRCFF